MGKYTFFNSIIDDESFVKYLAVIIKNDLLMGSFEDDLRILSNKIIAQYGYSFEFEYLNFNDPKVISAYKINDNIDVYAQKLDDKKIYILFNKKLKSNFHRYLFLKVWAYDIIDAWKIGDEIQLSIKENKTWDEVIAERIAIEMTLTRWQLKLYDENTIDPALKRALAFCEPELLEIRRKNYKDDPTGRSWSLLSVRKKDKKK